MSRIVRLEAENIKRLQAVEIAPDGNMVVIGGQNSAGKSSVLDSIMYALGGGRSLPAEPIRRGAKSGRVVVETEDLIVTRTFTAGGSYLKVEAKTGGAFPSPQAVLDRLVGTLTFDPLAFQRQAPKEQVGTLLALLGLDFSALDAERAEVYADRAAENGELKRMKDRAALMLRHQGAPAEVISTADLMERFRKATEWNAARTKATQRAADLAGRLSVVEVEIDEAEASLKLLREEAESLRLRIDAANDDIKGDFVDLSVIRDDLKEVEAVNEKVRTNRATQEAVDALRKRESGVQALSRRLDEIDEAKRAAIAAAKFPVDGLAFDGDRVLFNGLPLDQASSSEQLRVSAAMGFALNPGLKILLIRDGSLLDEQSMGLMAQMAEAADGQVWIERVGEGKESTVIIENGRVK